MVGVAELVDVAGVEDIRYLVDDQVVTLLGCDAHLTAVLWGEMAFFEQVRHRLGRLVVARGRKLGDEFVQRDTVVHQHGHPLDRDRRGVGGDRRVVGGHYPPELLVEGGLWLRESDGVVVARNHHHLHVTGHVL